MEILKETIRNKGTITEDNILHVDSFINYQMDVKLFNEIGKEFKERFKNEKIDKILTVESAGIGISAITSQYFDCVPVVFGKKMDRVSRDALGIYKSEVYSFTKNTLYNVVVKDNLIKKGEKILIIDDFLANASGAFALMDIVKQAGAEVVGVGIVIEKAFQKGRENLENKGIRVESLVSIEKIENGKVYFAK
ncbi:MAG: xanthine phosphoribosyltransferase [Sarcina ventriculi]|uniref:Xanthine phosphoribosyltransferase n=2 Tax=Sarcina TaxID=1266 RepID=A0ACD1BBM6_9CLOT|nr:MULTISPECIES: xanthine phosphoribosyltransferase [Sarcina]MDO4402399.1 xanthine phosphoribosyltransferase [Clostridiaceae bacterium]MBU5322518.1 xanthine phosphoribosyltransferase [Sarcina ventriculi]MCI5635703.1 xanthine phosphoribosyltransferase [Sarcina ventriculi]MDD7374362.1 xanthine phosphoribosyltransferase [Sarcina ventriculi]MDY7062414.1 xanthine phosphoribosyltransferase [Sarcina ventriculi]